MRDKDKESVETKYAPGVEYLGALFREMFGGTDAPLQEQKWWPNLQSLIFSIRLTALEEAARLAEGVAKERSEGIWSPRDALEEARRLAEGFVDPRGEIGSPHRAGFNKAATQIAASIRSLARDRERGLFNDETDLPARLRKQNERRE